MVKIFYNISFLDNKKIMKITIHTFLFSLTLLSAGFSQTNEASFLISENEICFLETNEQGYENRSFGLIHMPADEFKSVRPQIDKIVKNLAIFFINEFQKENHSMDLMLFQKKLLLNKESFRKKILPQLLQLNKDYSNKWLNIILPEEYQGDFDCRAYALSKTLRNNKHNISTETAVEAVNNPTKFDKLLSDYFTNIPFCEALDGDMVVYYDQNDESVHVGIYRIKNKHGIVESKWGNYPIVVQHEIFFTFASYGDEVRFYRLKR
jgi:hypothetical protein